MKRPKVITFQHRSGHPADVFAERDRNPHELFRKILVNSVAVRDAVLDHKGRRLVLIPSSPGKKEYKKQLIRLTQKEVSGDTGRKPLILGTPNETVANR